jgi:hypothetical protein
VYRNHIRGSVRGSTFRWTLAALLRREVGLHPKDGRRMTAESEAKLSKWITTHLAISWFACSDADTVLALETDVLALLNPPLNLEGMCATELRARLRRLRSEFIGCVPRGETGRELAPSDERRVADEVMAAGPTPDELAEQLGFPDGKQIRGFLRKHFPRSATDSGLRWGPLPPAVVAAVRKWAEGRSLRAR